MVQSPAPKLLEVKLGQTLRVHFPLGQTLGLTVLIFVALGGSSEALARTTFFKQQILVPISRVPASQFGTKLALLREQDRQTGPVDCIVVGNSVAQWGLNAQVVADTYQSQTGQALQCFNFAIDGLHPQTVAPLAQYLAKTFHPLLIIYGLNDWFSNLYYAPRKDPIIDSPWFQYLNGHGSLAGWLSEQSYAYRYFPGLLAWLELGDPPTLKPELFDLNGDPPTDALTTSINVTQPPDPTTEGAWFHDLLNYQLPQQTLDAFDQIASLKSTQVLIVEIPTHPSYVLYYPNGLTGKEAALKQIREFFETRKVLYWTTERQPEIPDSDWQDRVHLRLSGAKLISSWLGKHMAQAAANGDLQLSRR